MVELLLLHGAEAVAETETQWTALHWATHGGYVEVVQLLLAAEPAALEVKVYRGSLYWR